MASVMPHGNRRVFNSVFSLFTTEQQITAPHSSTTSITQTINRNPLQQSQSWSSPQSNNDQITWDAAWRVITNFLSLPAEEIDEEFAGRLLDPNDEFHRPVDASISEAFRIVLHPKALVPSARLTDSLEQWYRKSILAHFKLRALPYLSSLGISDVRFIGKSLRILAGLRRLYESRATTTGRGARIVGDERVESLLLEIERYFQALVSSIWLPAHEQTLRITVFGYLSAALDSATYDPNREFSFVGESQGRDTLVDMVGMLRYVGLAGERFQAMLNELLGLCMTKLINSNYKETWRNSEKNQRLCEENDASQYSISRKSSEFDQSPSTECAKLLDHWVEHSFARLITELLAALDLSSAVIDLQAWKLIAKDTLARLRSNELYDVVVSWPDSEQAIVDLRATITTPFQRSYLIETYRNSLREQLLHPGSSTLEILRVYISMIRCFHALDSAKVLLDNVAHELQAYVCSREDTVRIIITGLLTDTAASQLSSERLVELALLLDAGEHVNQNSIDDELDWHDLEWTPRPVDAGPGFKRSKSADIIGTLIGMLGSQEIFIREFQNTIGETLLKQDGNFQREIKVLDLLKSRFGEAPLQSCDVMIRDVQISRPTNIDVRQAQKLDVSAEELRMATEMQDGISEPATMFTRELAEGLLKPSFNAKILSRMYWPQLHEETYHVPAPIYDMQLKYEKGFEAIKKARKLTWLHHLGQVDIELHFDDRIIDETVHTWQATVIYAFEGDGVPGKSVERTVDQLVEMLDMDETLVRSALTFWVGKLVLHSSTSDTYTVIEDLSMFDTDRDSAEVAAAAAATENAEDPALLANEQDSTEELKKYWPLIQGMLTNTMPQMPLGQIGMMLRMVVEGGFHFGDEELGEYLNGEVENGVLEMVAGRYKLKK